MSNKIKYIILIMIMAFTNFAEAYAQTEGTNVISKNKLIAIGKIDVSVEDFNFDVEYKVISYRASATISGYLYEILNMGATFSNKTIELIKKLKRGQRIYFEDIKVKYPDGRIRVIKPLVYKII